MTIGDFIAALHALEGEMPDGADSEIVLGVCDGTGVTTVPNFEVATMTIVDQAGTSRRHVGLIRGHPHSGGGDYLPGVAESAGK